MEQLLSLSFIERLSLMESGDDLKKVIGSIFQTQNIEPTQVHALLAPLKELREFSKSYYEEALIRLLCVALLSKMSESVKEEVEKSLKSLFYSIRHSSPFESKELEGLIACLIDCQIEASSAGEDPFDFFQKQKDLLFSTFRDIFEEKNPKLLKSSLPLLLKFVENDRSFFYGFQEKEENFDRINFLAAHYINLFLASKFYSSALIDKAMERVLTRLESASLEKLSPGLILLFLYADLHFQLEKKPLTFDDDLIEANDGFVIGETSIFSYVFSLRGKGTGLGAIHKEKVKILSFGPHYAPLGSMENFGIWSETAEVIHADGEGKILKGWTKVVEKGRENASPSLLWLFSEMRVLDRSIQLEIQYKESHSSPLVVFFIQADEAQIDEKRLYPGSLERFSGRTKDLSFSKEKEYFEFNFDHECEIIPLAGQDHFWGADFLLAIKPSELNQKVSIHLH
ncbi:MAG: hypothetical protein WDZ28_05905 [Simkaniaceae bacterium]